MQLTTSPAPTSGYSGPVPPEIGGTAGAVGNSQAPASKLTSKERHAISETIWRRFGVEPVGPPPRDPQEFRAWKVEGQMRGTLNFLGIAKTLDEHAEEQGLEAIRRFPLCPQCAKDEIANEQYELLGEPPYQISVCRAH